MFLILCHLLSHKILEATQAFIHTPTTLLDIKALNYIIIIFHNLHIKFVQIFQFFIHVFDVIFTVFWRLVEK